MKLRNAIPAGLVDTGATALAMFTIQAYAVRTLAANDLGVYALFLSAYLFSSLTAQFVLLYPLEVGVLSLDRGERLPLIRRSLRLVVVTPVTAAAGATLALLVASGEATAGTLMGLAVTSGMAGAAAPFYEHLKRMLHLSEMSGRAAVVAVSQLLIVGGAGVALIGFGVDPAWVPFGALATSQVGAAVVGLVIIRIHTLGRSSRVFGLKELLGSGRWLLIVGLVPAGGSFVAAVLISRLAGVDVLGFAQAAHVAGRPVLVLATGLGAVLGFRLMEAGAAGSVGEGNRLWRLYAVLVGLGTLVYFAIAGPDWPGNPIAALLPRAYEVAGLVAVMIVANLSAALIRPTRDELIGGRKEPRVAAVDSVGALTVVLVAGSSAILKSFALPLGVLAASIIQGFAYIPARRALYRGESDQIRSDQIRSD